MINYKHPVVQEDLQVLANCGLSWEELRGASVLITGATGMLASYFSFILLYLNDRYDFNIKVIMLARSEEKLNSVFGPQSKNVEWLIQDVGVPISYAGHIDYILHAAGGASPQHIVNTPTEVISANVLGTRQVMELAHEKMVRKTIFASTREIYGRVENRSVIDEADTGTLDPLDPRSCYPESKRLAETMLKAYESEFGVSFNTLRIAHVYGPGMAIANDGRVMADLVGDAVHGRDIQLKSSGQAERAFCYITDAIEAMYAVMLSGQPGQAYNVANEGEAIKIVELAHLLQKVAGNGKKVQVADDEGPGEGYTNYERVALSTERLAGLGWCPRVMLEDGLEKTLRAFDD